MPIDMCLFLNIGFRFFFFVLFSRPISNINYIFVLPNLKYDLIIPTHLFIISFNIFLLLTPNQLLLFIFRLKVWLPTRLAFNFTIGF